MKLISYVVEEPQRDEHKIAYKFPYNAAEILSGENTYLLDKFFEDSNINDEDKYEDLNEDEGKKIDNDENHENETHVVATDCEESKNNKLETKEDILKEIDSVVESMKKVSLTVEEEENQEKVNAETPAAEKKEDESDNKINEEVSVREVEFNKNEDVSEKESDAPEESKAEKITNETEKELADVENRNEKDLKVN
jgi:hypothetical protein